LPTTLLNLVISTNTYTNLYSVDAYSRQGGLIQGKDGKLYGAGEAGVVFSFDLVSNTFTYLITAYYYGQDFKPMGSLVHANDGKLYGMSDVQSGDSYGYIFSLDPVTRILSRLYEFQYHPLGGSLIETSDGKLWGMNDGTIFYFDPVTAAFTPITLDYPNVIRTHGTLLQASDSKLYGINYVNGQDPDGNYYGFGCIFSIDPITEIYTKLADFNAINRINSYTYGFFGSLIEYISPVVITLDDLTNVTCNGQNNGAINITVSGGIAPYTFVWSKDGNSGYSSNEDLTNLSPGTYALLLTDDYGSTTTLQVGITQPPLLTAVATGTSTTCSNSASVAASGGTSPYSYLWNIGASTQSISSVPAGTYSVTVTDANGCIVLASCTVTASEAFNPSASVTNISCYGGTNGTIIVTNVNGVAPFQYSLDGINFQTNNVFNNLAASTYIVTVKDVNGCTGFVTKIITQPTLLSVVLTTVNNTCYGLSTGSISVGISGGSPSYTYLWAGPNGYSSSQLNISNLASGSYTLTVTDNNSCSITLNPFVSSFNQITVNPIVANVGCKAGSNGSIALNTSGGTGSGFRYLWSNGATTGSINNLVAGNYNVTITDIGSGCIKTGSYSITQPFTAVILSTSKTNATGCNNLGVINLTGSGGTPGYQYKLDNGIYQASGSFGGLYAGSYTVWVKDANGCIKSAALSITDNGSDEYESNNSKSKAKLVSIGTSISARIALATDVADWFMFTTPAAGGNYILTLNHPSVNYTFSINIAGNNAVALIPVDSTATSKEYVLNGNTTYYVSLTGALSYVCYQLTISTPLLTRSSVNSLQNEVQADKAGNGLFDVVVYGNPSHTGFIFQVRTSSKDKMQLKVFDAVGRMIELGEKMQPDQLLRLGDNYIKGVYLVEIIQGKNRKVTKLVKQ